MTLAIADEEMNIITLTFFLTLILTAAAIWSVRSMRNKLASYLIAVMFLFSIGLLTFGVGGLRPHIIQMRSLGASEQFINGMIERDRATLPPKVALGVAITGLFLSGFAVIRLKRNHNV